MSSPVSGTSEMDAYHQSLGDAYGKSFQEKVERYRQSAEDEVSDKELWRQIHLDESSEELEVIETAEERLQRYQRSKMDETSDPEYWMTVNHFSSPETSEAEAEAPSKSAKVEKESEMEYDLPCGRVLPPPVGEWPRPRDWPSGRLPAVKHRGIFRLMVPGDVQLYHVVGTDVVHFRDCPKLRLWFEDQKDRKKIVILNICFCLRMVGYGDAGMANFLGRNGTVHSTNYCRHWVSDLYQRVNGCPHCIPGSMDPEQQDVTFS